jgi:hypothetical protein
VGNAKWKPLKPLLITKIINQKYAKAGGVERGKCAEVQVPLNDASSVFCVQTRYILTENTELL